MLTDTRVVASHQLASGAHLDVLAHRDEVVFGDDSTVWLHTVHRDGSPDKFLRAIQAEGLVWSVFDVRKLSSSIERDILSAPRRDEPGLVLFTFRMGYAGARDFLRRVAEVQLDHWWRDVTEAATS